MKDYLKGYLLVTAATFVVAAIAMVGHHFTQENTPVVYNQSTVKLLIPEGGHGSGTHIGNGFVITAGHVAEDNEFLIAKTEDGKEQRAEVLWTDVERDISLVRLEDWDSVEASNLECRIPHIGEQVTMEGNPLNMEFITTNGYVAGAPMQKVGPWLEVLPVDGALAGGMSGGGMFDKDGDLIGVNVGIPLQPLGFGSTATGISYIVPAPVVCDLLAR